MLKKWLKQRGINKYFSLEEDWYQRLQYQHNLPIFSEAEPSPMKLDRHRLKVEAGTIVKLISELEKVIYFLSVREHPPKTEKIKGEKTLTEYLVDEEGYPFPVTKADEIVSKLLYDIYLNFTDIETGLPEMVSYYHRKYGGLITEAIKFREEVSRLK